MQLKISPENSTVFKEKGSNIWLWTVIYPSVALGLSGIGFINFNSQESVFPMMLNMFVNMALNGSKWVQNGQKHLQTLKWGKKVGNVFDTWFWFFPNPTLNKDDNYLNGWPIYQVQLGTCMIHFLDHLKIGHDFLFLYLF